MSKKLPRVEFAVTPEERKMLDSEAKIMNCTRQELIRDRLLSADGKQAMLWIQMAVTDDFDNQRDLFVGQVRASAAKHLGEMSYALAGMGVIYTGLNQALEQMRKEHPKYQNLDKKVIIQLLN